MKRRAIVIVVASLLPVCASSAQSPRLELVGPNPRGASIPLSEFVADAAPTESAGECVESSPFGPNSKVVMALFPSRAEATMNASLTFDSVGHLIRYNETRGFVGLRGVALSAPPAERDSARAAQQAATRSTSISLDYTIGVAFLRNFGGGKAPVIATAPVSVVEKMPVFGPVDERVARVRKLCGV
jgi:hypothetical protein